MAVSDIKPSLIVKLHRIFCQSSPCFHLLLSAKGKLQSPIIVLGRPLHFSAVSHLLTLSDSRSHSYQGSTGLLLHKIINIHMARIFQFPRVVQHFPVSSIYPPHCAACSIRDATILPAMENILVLLPVHEAISAHTPITSTGFPQAGEPLQAIHLLSRLS